MTTPCPHCGKPINPAALLGARNAGGTKRISQAESVRRRKSLAEARLRRHQKPLKTS